jgi:hypothetical protein
MMESTNRVDAFTDAAFAFAVSLLVIGGAGAPSDLSQLTRALADIPAFAFGFAIIALFWLGHMRWRKLRGAGDSRSLLLTLMLVFLTLIYVQPLRGMAAATGLWFDVAADGSLVLRCAAQRRPNEGGTANCSGRASHLGNFERNRTAIHRDLFHPLRSMGCHGLCNTAFKHHSVRKQVRLERREDQTRSNEDPQPR